VETLYKPSETWVSRSWGRGAYLFVVKANPPTLFEELKDAFEGLEGHFHQTGGAVPPWLKREWNEAGVTFTRTHTFSKGHGRREVRECWALSDPELNGYVGIAGAAGIS
jgi:hypothetical protein